MHGADKAEKLALCSSRVGTHSMEKEYRRTDLEMLGPEILIYLRMLKYFGCCFILFFILSLPSIAIYPQGQEFDEYPVFIQKLFGWSTLGNLGNSRDISIGTLSVQNISMEQKIDLKCRKNQKLIDLVSLAFLRKINSYWIRNKQNN